MLVTVRNSYFDIPVTSLWIQWCYGDDGTIISVSVSDKNHRCSLSAADCCCCDAV